MQKLGDVSPLISVYLMGIKYDPLLLIIYRRFLDAWIQVIVPPLPALFAGPPSNMVLIRQLLGDEGPPLRTVFGHQVHDGVIFLGGINKWG